MLARDRKVALKRALLPLAAGAALAAMVSAAYAIPYLRVQAQVGERSGREIMNYSASPANYLATTSSNWLYGSSTRSLGEPERRLFPGAIPILLALVGLLLRRPSARAIVYCLLLVAAFETSLGFFGHVYPFLYNHVPVYRSLRAPARLGVCVLMFLGVLAAYGYQALVQRRPAFVRAAVVAALAVGLIAEYHVTFGLAAYANAAPPIYRFLAGQPRGVVAEFPVPRGDTLPGDDAEYSYLSTFHWFPIVNGYSGTYPPSYLARLEQLAGFPDDRSIRQLRRNDVAYVIVHGSSYPGAAFGDLRNRIALGGVLVELGSFDDVEGRAVLYHVR